jgi:hypothetical protein
VQLFGFCIPGGQHSRLARNALFETAFLLIGIIFGAFVISNGKHKAFLVVPFLCVIFILALPFLELSPVKPASPVADIKGGQLRGNASA